MGEAHGFDGEGERADLGGVDACCGEAVADAGGVAGAVDEDLGDLTAGEEDEGALVGVVETGDGGGDEAAEAGALEADEGGIDLREGGDGVAGAADVGDGLLHGGEETADVGGADGRAGTVAGEVDDERVKIAGAEPAGDGAGGGHAATGFVDDDDGGGFDGLAVWVASLVPFEGDAVVDGIAGGGGAGEADEEVAGLVSGRFGDDGEVGGGPEQVRETAGGVRVGVRGRGEGVVAGEGLADGGFGRCGGLRGLGASVEECGEGEESDEEGARHGGRVSGSVAGR